MVDTRTKPGIDQVEKLMTTEEMAEVMGYGKRRKREDSTMVSNLKWDSVHVNVLFVHSIVQNIVALFKLLQQLQHHLKTTTNVRLKSQESPLLMGPNLITRRVTTFWLENCGTSGWWQVIIFLWLFKTISTSIRKAIAATVWPKIRQEKAKAK